MIEVVHRVVADSMMTFDWMIVESRLTLLVVTRCSTSRSDTDEAHRRAINLAQVRASELLGESA